jgi:hypothetical protein
MTAARAVAEYYEAWRNRRGDMSGVPLAADFRFLGPVATFETAEAYREMARQAGQAMGPEDEDAALARPHTRAMDFTARPMRGFVTVAPDGLNGQALRRWVDRALAHAETQPPRQPKRRAVRR